MVETTSGGGIITRIKSIKNIGFIAVALICGLALLAGGFLFGGNGKSGDTGASSPTVPVYSADDGDYAAALEQKAQSLINAVAGVSGAQVMITLDNTGEQVYAQNSQQANSSGDVSSTQSYVIITDADKNQYAVPIKLITPKIRGVAVVADFGGQASLQLDIIRMLSTVFGVSTNKISVVQGAKQITTNR